MVLPFLLAFQVVTMVVVTLLPKFPICWKFYGCHWVWHLVVYPQCNHRQSWRWMAQHQKELLHPPRVYLYMPHPNPLSVIVSLTMCMACWSQNKLSFLKWSKACKRLLTTSLRKKLNIGVQNSCLRIGKQFMPTLRQSLKRPRRHLMWCNNLWKIIIV